MKENHKTALGNDGLKALTLCRDGGLFPVALRRLFVNLLVTIICWGAIPIEVIAASDGYEVLLINKSTTDFFDIKLCIDNGGCYSGELKKNRSVWLDKLATSREPLIKITTHSKSHDFEVILCEIALPKTSCAYEVSLSNKGLVCPKTSADCTRF